MGEVQEFSYFSVLCRSGFRGVLPHAAGQATFHIGRIDAGPLSAAHM